MLSPTPTRVHNKTFSCTSFKDIQLLVADNKNPTPIFHRVNSLIRSWATRNHITLQNTEDKIVIYYTSLRVVRSTAENCSTVRSILKSFPVQIDERDVSIDNTYLTELHKIFNQKSKIYLPKVFIGGKYIGGADEIRNLHESGELKNLLANLPATRGGVCECCGGMRFVLCEECNGSMKCYWEKGGGFRTCGACNENGLVRCRECS